MSIRSIYIYHQRCKCPPEYPLEISLYIKAGVIGIAIKSERSCSIPEKNGDQDRNPWPFEKADGPVIRSKHQEELGES